ncbi:hypothetical protein [Bifidobacterium sp.]|uniref:hypothetical protein n=1 Tax=unclassified Bifidobacterium TaxID=2608897 RepID=UPI002A916EE6|nr:hypothetical protein [Bifidobacterium sp.]MDY5367732.1 hypothetical protein [Bifidobacterium sp.]
MVVNESVASLLPYVSSTLVPIVTALSGLVKNTEKKKTKILSRYIGIRKTMVDSGYSGAALTGVDEIIDSETQRLKKIYDKQSDREIDPAGVAAIVFVGVIEILVTFWSVNWALAMPANWPKLIRIIIWSFLVLLILAMILFIVVGTATSIFKKKEPTSKDVAKSNPSE